MPYVFKLTRSTNRLVLKRTSNVFKMKHVGRRGLKGDKGDQGEPGSSASNLVTSVNGQQGVVVLDSADIGADAVGSATTALSAANGYTDTQVSALDTELAVVAKTGAYADLLNKPTIPTINYPVTSVNTRTGAVTGLAEQSDLTAHTSNISNPHGVTKAQLGLSNAEDTTDLNKPISTATQTALDGKVSSSTGTGNLLYSQAGS